MTSTFKALVVDLGGVLMEWDRHSNDILSPAQFRAMINSTTWHSMDRGEVTLKEACEELGKMLGVDVFLVEAAFNQALLTLKSQIPLVQTIQDIKAANPDLKLYIMSNISREHFEMVLRLDLPWSMFDKAFVSGIVGMRKPDLCFFQHVIKHTGLHPSEMIMIDDMTENVCAARSQGMHAILADQSSASVGRALRNLLQDPLPRAEAFLKNQARNHDCVISGQEEIRFKDNFAQLMMWKLTGDENLVYLKWPNGKTHGMDPTPSVNGHATVDHCNGHGNAVATSDVKNGLWNYFFDASVLTTNDFPPDADTTSMAYLSLPEQYLSTLPDVHLVLNKMITNIDRDGIMQVYFDDARPRTLPEVCVNIFRLIHKFASPSSSSGPSPSPFSLESYTTLTQKSEDFIISCLHHNACQDGTRHYSTPEPFLYFLAQLYSETHSLRLRSRLDGTHSTGLTPQLISLLNTPCDNNALALAFRLAACQSMRMDAKLYAKDLERFLAMQDEDGGWPAGHFCRFGRTGVRIGNRGLVTALGVRILRGERGMKGEGKGE